MSGGSALLAVQTAIYGKLTGDGTLSGLVSGRIYDAPPAVNPAYPYIIIGDAFERRDDTFQSHGKTLECEISIWGIDAGVSGTSSKSGYSPLLTIANRIAIVLDGTESSFSVSGYQTGEITHTDTNTERMVDGAVILRHVGMTFRIYVHL